MGEECRLVLLVGRAKGKKYGFGTRKREGKSGGGETGFKGTLRQESKPRLKRGARKKRKLNRYLL